MAVKASSQVTLIDVSDSYSVTLTSEAYTFTGGTSGAASGLTCSTQAQAYCGTSQCTSVSITASAITCPTGITATVTNNGTSSPTVTFTTTATITASCEATIPVVVNGITINKKFSFAVAKTGATGATGATGKTALQPTRNWSAAHKTVGETASCSTSDFNRTPVVGDTFMNIDGGSNTGTWKVTAVSGTTVTIQLLSYVNSKGATGATGATGSTAKRAGAIKASAAITAGNLIVGNSSGYHHLKTGGSFDISYGVLYANSAISSGSTGSDNYTTINFMVTTTQSLTLTAYKAVYIKGKLTGPTFTPVSTAPLTQTVPTTADGYFYMLVGTATSTTTISLCEDHAVYRYLNGKFQAMGSTADETVLSWCKNSDLTYIDGGKLYANSVTAAKINTTDLFAQTVTATNMTITGNSVFKGKLSGASGDFSGALTAQSLTLGDGTVKMTWGTDIYNEYAAEIYYNNNYAPWTGLIVHNEGVTMHAYGKTNGNVTSDAEVSLEATGYVSITGTESVKIDECEMKLRTSGDFRKFGRVVVAKFNWTRTDSLGTIPSDYRPISDTPAAAVIYLNGKCYQGFLWFKSDGGIEPKYFNYAGEYKDPVSGCQVFCNCTWIGTP